MRCAVAPQRAPGGESVAAGQRRERRAEQGANRAAGQPSTSSSRAVTQPKRS